MKFNAVVRDSFLTAAFCIEGVGIYGTVGKETA